MSDHAKFLDHCTGDKPYYCVHAGGMCYGWTEYCDKDHDRVQQCLPRDNDLEWCKQNYLNISAYSNMQCAKACESKFNTTQLFPQAILHCNDTGDSNTILLLVLVLVVFLVISVLLNIGFSVYIWCWQKKPSTVSEVDHSPERSVSAENEENEKHENSESVLLMERKDSECSGYNSESSGSQNRQNPESSGPALQPNDMLQQTDLIDVTFEGQSSTASRSGQQSSVCGIPRPMPEAGTDGNTKVCTNQSSRSME